MAKILLVEDHENISKSLKAGLEAEGFTVDVAPTLAAAREKKGADLVVLDWNLPDGQGIDYLSDLRKQGVTAPVIFLTARVDVVDKVLGLEMGADDYMTKPFESRELVARIRARLRASNGVATIDGASPLVVGPLVIDRIKHKVTYKDAAVALVKKEFELLVLLAESPEKVFSRDEILNKVWGYDVYPTTRTVDTHVLQLRQKLDESLIETVRAVGYRLRRL
jgi:DNA-binding response OmpR family regulator